MASDRDSTIDRDQIEDRTIQQLELDLTNTPTDGQFFKVNMPAGNFTAVDAPSIVDLTATVAVNQTNIVLNAFRIAIDASRSRFNMVDGIVDEYEDENSVDNPNSTNESYDSGNDLYSPVLGEFDTNTKLLLHLDGTDADTFTSDSSTFNHSISFSGNAQIDTAQSKFGVSSCLLDGSGDWLATSVISFDFNPDTSDYTVDFWVRFVDINFNSNARQSFFSTTNTLIFAEWRPADGNIRVGWDGAGIIETSWTPVNDQWFHIAFVRNGGNLQLFVDGVQLGATGSVSDIASSSADQTIFIGASNNSGIRPLNGWIDEFRVSKGIARWTSNFTPPIEEYLPDPANMTLISDSFTAEAQPDNARIVIFEEDVDSITLNTDLKAFVTRDAGQTFTTDFATDDKLDITSHGFSNDDRIMVTSSSQDLPAGLDSATVYYVINVTTNDFELSLTSGGSAIDITDNGTGTHTAKQVSQITLANDGEYESGKNILTGSIDISGQPSGVSMEYNLVTANQKDLKIHGTSISWDD